MRHRLVLSIFLFSLLLGCSSGGGDNDSPDPGGSSASPATPSGVAITVQPTSLNVFWNDVPGASSYNVYYADQPDVDRQSTRVSAAAGPATLTNLSSGTTYYVRVSAVNAVGESDLSTEQQARTSAPPAPVQTVTVTPADGGAIVNWEAVSNADRYTVFASTMAGDVSNALSVETNLTTVSVEGLTNGVLYYVSVRAENIEGDAARSAEVTVTPTVGGPGLGWSQQTLINAPYDFFGRDNYLGGVAINDAGVAAAAWIFDGSVNGNNFVIANHTANGDWGGEEMLAEGDNSTPVLAVTPNGVIVAAWIRHYLDANGICEQRKRHEERSRHICSDAYTGHRSTARLRYG